MKKLTLVLSIACLTMVGMAQTTWHVKPTGNDLVSGMSWANAFKTLQKALDTAQAGDQIWVANGTYFPTKKAGNGTNDEDKAFVLLKDVKLYGGFAGTETALNQRQLPPMGTPSGTILSGDLKGQYYSRSSHVVISVGNVGTACLDGFTIADGHADTMGNDIFVDGYTVKSINGGGVYLCWSSPTLSNLTISKNITIDYMGKGGGIYAYNSLSILTNVTISENMSRDGGGIYSDSSSLTLTDVNINKNTAYNGNGGGIYIYAYEFTATNLSIINNEATLGGGMYIEYSYPSVTNARISGNKTTQDGGGMYNYGGISTLTNTILSGNKAIRDGGGMFNEASSPILINVTVSGNNADSGGGMYNNTSSCSPIIRNSVILTNSSGVSGYQGNMTCYNSLIQERTNTANNCISATAVQGLKLFVNPANFTNAPTTSGDYRLATNSPLINKGNNTYNATPFDLAGNQRIDGGTIDIGAYEFAGNKTIHVKPSGNDAADGKTWATAFKTLQKALDVTNEGDTIWVANGTYKPTKKAGNGVQDRDMAFVLKAGVALYGGFAGTETSINQRQLPTLGDTKNGSILSGDIGVINDTTDNCYHVVISVGDTTVPRTLDGFTITGSYADGSGNITILGYLLGRSNGGGIYSTNSSLILANVTICGNRVTGGGGGMHNDTSSLVFTNVAINGNRANIGGGGIAILSSSLVFTDVTINNNVVAIAGGGIHMDHTSAKLTNINISGNYAVAVGGGMHNCEYSSIEVTNATICGNTASSGCGIFNANVSPIFTNVVISGNMTLFSNDVGGGVYNVFSSPIFRNTVIWGNNKGGVLDDVGCISTYSHCLIQGRIDTINGCISAASVTGAIFRKPTDTLEAPTSSGDYRLAANSPLINKGNNTYNATPFDLAGNPRICEGTIDIGAYEFAGNKTIYVKSSGNDAADGKTWTTAFQTLQKALDMAIAGDQIWVAKGTYKPTKKAGGDNNTNRDMAFLLKADVKIYGGFAGTETTLAQRTLPAFGTPSATILSGDIGNPGNNSDNCYHVVISLEDTTSAGTLDGFTITGGNADGIGTIYLGGTSISRDAGGGIYNYTSSPTLTNVTFSGNAAEYGGGGIYNHLASPTLTNVCISENSTDGYGGGICALFSSPILTNVNISGNTATLSGGGMYNDYSSPILTNIVISGNVAIESGGGMYNGISHITNITNVTISGNMAPQGGGMHNYCTKPTIRNTIVWGNNTGMYNNRDGGYDEEDEDDNDNPFYSHCLIQERNVTTNGCINADSITWDIFVSPADTLDAPTTNGDYRLAAGSPCINTGNNAFFSPDSTPNLSKINFDLDRNLRIYNKTVDMGAYEYGSTPAPGIVETQCLASLVQVYPNPAQGTLYIRSEEAVEQVSIYDISGRMLLTMGHAPLPEQGIDISHLANGIYIIKVKTGTGETTKKIVINN